VKKLKSTLIPSVGTTLYIKDHLTICLVLDDARKVEEGCLETFYYHPRGSLRNGLTLKPTSGGMPPKPGTSLKDTTTTPGVVTIPGANNPNARFGLVVIKTDS
jgi:hypothetical protein